MHVFLGITGASGAPYAARLLQALAAGGAEVGVCISDAGVQVCATELYGDISLSRDEVTARLTDGLEGVTVVGLRDYTTPYASGSARVDGYVVCPCSMSTAASVAAGAMANLVHRAASVALKEERKLLLVPRETPLSAIHLENLLAVTRAGALVIPAAPSFYTRPRSVEHVLDTVLARVLDHLDIPHTLLARWGDATEAGNPFAKEK